MQRGFNKRGQEGFSTTGVLAMVVGVIALVVIGIFIYNAYSQPKELAKLLPDEYQKALLYCSEVASNLPEEQYCIDYKEFSVGSALSSKTYYYNCHDLELQSGKSNTRCDDIKYAETECMKLAGNGDIETGKVVYVSSKSCSYTAASTSTSAVVKLDSQDLSAEAVSRYPTLREVSQN